jgi:hypothetical protein
VDFRRFSLAGLLLLGVGSFDVRAQANPTAQKQLTMPPDDPRGNCGLIYGKGHSFWVCAPTGWILDNQVLAKDGVYAAFYPHSSTFDEAMHSATVMYVNTMTKSIASQATVGDAMKTDSDGTAKRMPGVTIEKRPDLKTKDSIAQVQSFVPHGGGRYEAVAYIDSPNVIVMCILTSAIQEAFDRDYPEFEKLVGSYEYFTNNVDIKK